MNKLASRVILSTLVLGFANNINAGAPDLSLRSIVPLATDGVLMAWSFGEQADRIELIREDNALFMTRTSSDGSIIQREQVRLVADSGKLIYLPANAADGRFFTVTSDGILHRHDSTGEIGFDGTIPTLIEIQEDQQKLLDTIAPKEPSWTDVIDSLTGDAASSTENGGSPTPAVRVDPNRLDIVEQEDGTKLINDRFVLAGEGTKENPYEITWEYLTSVRETYQPREGLRDIAAHVKMLDGKYIKLGGYLQFPLAAPEPKELLMMLNQWDGCCIGIPPTPYDALEVSLAAPATRGEKFAAEGSLVGVLKIDPYLVGDWLIGLYIIGDASLDVSGARPATEVYGNSPTASDPNASPAQHSRSDHNE